MADSMYKCILCNFTFMLPCIVIDFFLNNQPDAPIIQIYSVIKLYLRIQKARGSFSKLRKVYLSKSLRKDIKIRIFNACVKSVLLYGCETWIVTNEIQRKIQTFVNRCLTKNMVAKYYFQRRSMESNRTRRYKFRNKKKKI